MSGFLSRLRRCRRGVAAVEFALVCTLLMIMLGGITDFGLALLDKSRLANAVARGVQYASLHPSYTSGQIQTAVLHGSSLPSDQSLSNHVTAAVSVNACYCITGTPPALSAAADCATNCADGSKPGTYVVISASYTYAAILPGFSEMTGTKTFSETATARVK
jgi:Flp pilus assembly protein TadG